MLRDLAETRTQGSRFFKASFIVKLNAHWKGKDMILDIFQKFVGGFVPKENHKH